MSKVKTYRNSFICYLLCGKEGAESCKAPRGACSNADEETPSLKRIKIKQPEQKEAHDNGL